MAVEGGGDYRQRLVQRQLQIKKRKQAGLSNTRANAGPPSSSKTFSSPPKSDKASLNRFATQGASSRDDKIITYGGKAMAYAAPNIPAIIRGITDPVGTAKGVAEISSYTNPATLIQRGVNAYRGEGFTKPLMGADAQDIEQAAEIAGIIPYGKAIKASSYLAKYSPDLFRLLKQSKISTSGANISFPRTDPNIAFTSVRLSPRGVKTKNVPIVAGGAPEYGIKGSEKAIERVSGSGLSNDPLSAADSALTIIQSTIRNNSLLPKLEQELEDFYLAFDRDPAGWGAQEKLAHRALQQGIKQETKNYTDEFATVVEAVQKNYERGIPVDLTLKDYGIKKSRFGWMLKYIDPEKVRAAKDVPHTLEGFTHTVDEMKKKIYKTLTDGEERQQKKILAGNPNITEITPVPYSHWSEIPDDIIDRLIEEYGINKMTGARDAKTGKVVPMFTVAWDHIKSLDKGGENEIEDNYQALIGILNSIKSSY